MRSFILGIVEICKKQVVSSVFRIFLLFLIIPSFVQAQEDVDYLALAQLLVKDGYYIRAERTLQKLHDDEIENRPMYLSLLGMIQLHRKKYDLSLKYFHESLQQGQDSKEIFLYIAEAQLQLKKYASAVDSLKKLNAEEKQKLPYFLLQAEALWQQGQKKAAFQVLSKAEGLGLSKNVITKKKFYYYLQDHLFLAAIDLAYSLLQDSNNFNDVLAMASQLRVAKQYEASLGLLQSLQVMRPGHEVVALEMAQNYLSRDENFSAALILENAAKHNPSLSFEASEMLRQIGKNYRARYLNLTTTDPQQRLKQQLALFLAEDDYTSLKFLIPQLNRFQLMEDQDIRYAVAYSLFRMGDFDRSKSFLDTIEKDGLFEKSIELKREIVNCQSNRWACFETI